MCGTGNRRNIVPVKGNSWNKPVVTLTLTVARVILGGSTKQTQNRDKMRPPNLRVAYPQITYVPHRSILGVCLVFQAYVKSPLYCVTQYTIYEMILSPLDYIHEWVQWSPWHSATLPPGLQYMYIYVYVYVYIYVWVCICAYICGWHIIRYVYRLSSIEMTCEFVWGNNLWRL